MVLAHARALLTSSPEGRCAYIDADIREPEKILNAAAEVLDFTEPVAVVLMAVLQFVPDDDDPHGIVRRLMAAVPAGSYLVISHPAADIQAAAMEPGVIRCPEWRPDRPQDAAGKSTMWGGVARKPDTVRS